MIEMGIAGAWVHTPDVYADSRGAFLEWFRQDRISAALGHAFAVAQANVSVSKRGALRGIHFAQVPPGQSKLVTCSRGAILDVVVDIRVGSPTFGKWEAERLDDETRRAVYIGEGLGHAFCALTDDATVVYLCSEPYAADREHGVNPLDPDLAIAWPDGLELLLSAKDQAAPTLDEALSSGLLPAYDDCVAYVEWLRGERQPPA